MLRKRNKIIFQKNKCPCGNNVIYPDKYCSYECYIYYKNSEEKNEQKRM